MAIGSIWFFPRSGSLKKLSGVRRICLLADKELTYVVLSDTTHYPGPGDLVHHHRADVSSNESVVRSDGGVCAAAEHDGCRPGGDPQPAGARSADPDPLCEVAGGDALRGSGEFVLLAPAGALDDRTEVALDPRIDGG